MGVLKDAFSWLSGEKEEGLIDDASTDKSEENNEIEETNNGSNDISNINEFSFPTNESLKESNIYPNDEEIL